MILIRILQAMLSVTILIHAIKDAQYLFLIPGIVLLYIAYRPLCSCTGGPCRVKR